MKEYRLVGWPELGPGHNRIAYRRLLSDMSQRFVSIEDLAGRSGLGRGSVARFVAELESRGLVAQRDARPPIPFRFVLPPWLQRAMGSLPARRI